MQGVGYMKECRVYKSGQIYEERSYMVGKMTGRREVVQWIEDNNYGWGKANVRVFLSDWQAFKKKIGVL